MLRISRSWHSAITVFCMATFAVGCSFIKSHPGHSGHDTVSLGNNPARQSHVCKILIVSSDNCRYCHLLEKELDTLRQLAGSQISVEVAKNIHEKIMQTYNVHIGSFPTTLVIVDGRVVQKIDGYHKAHALWNKIDKSQLQLG